MPILLTWAAGIMDIGLICFVHLQLTSAADEVVKLACLNDRNPTQLQNIFQAHMSVAGTSALQVTTSANNPNLGGRPSATITMSHTFPPVGLASLFRSGDITLVSVAITPVSTGLGSPGGLIPE